MSEWSSLPNAKHIDWVIQSMKDNPKEWAGSQITSRDEELKAAMVAAYDDVLQAARAVALLAIWDAVWDAASYAAWEAARCVLRALIAYDDCEKYLDMSYEELLAWSKLDPHPAGVLLLPYTKVKELTKEVDLV